MTNPAIAGIKEMTADQWRAERKKRILERILKKTPEELQAAGYASATKLAKGSLPPSLTLPPSQFSELAPGRPAAAAPAPAGQSAGTDALGGVDGEIAMKIPTKMFHQAWADDEDAKKREREKRAAFERIGKGLSKYDDASASEAIQELEDIVLNGTTLTKSRATQMIDRLRERLPREHALNGYVCFCPFCSFFFSLLFFSSSSACLTLLCLFFSLSKTRQDSRTHPPSTQSHFQSVGRHEVLQGRSASLRPAVYAVILHSAYRRPPSLLGGEGEQRGGGRGGKNQAFGPNFLVSLLQQQKKCKEKKRKPNNTNDVSKARRKQTKGKKEKKQANTSNNNLLLYPLPIASAISVLLPPPPSCRSCPHLLSFTLPSTPPPHTHYSLRVHKPTHTPRDAASSLLKKHTKIRRAGVQDLSPPRTARAATASQPASRRWRRTAMTTRLRTAP